MKLGRVGILSCIWIFTLTLFTGCPTDKTSKVEQSSIRTDYTLHYDDTDKTIIGESQFTQQKTQQGSNYPGTIYLELDNNSSVYFDETMMVANKNFWDQISYNRIQTGYPTEKIWGKHTFRYLQNNGESLENSVQGIGYPSLALPNGALSKTNGFKFTWALSEPIGTDSLELIWNSENRYPGYSIMEKKGFPSNTKQGSIQVSKEDLHGWETNRQYFIQLCRVRKNQLQKVPAAGGALKIISCSARQQISTDH